VTTTSPVGRAPVAPGYGLPLLGRRPGLFSYLGKVRLRLPFAIELASSRFRAENEADRLGVAWVVLRPLINAAVYGFVFSLLLSGSRPPNYVGFLVIGVFLFQYFGTCLQEGSRAILANRGLVTTLRFPRALLPIAVVVQATLALGPMVAVMVLVVAITKIVANQTVLTPEWLLIVPILAMMAMFNLGIAFFAARTTIHLRDVAQLIPFVTRILFYLSGVIWPVERMAAGMPSVKKVLEANPLNVYIEMTRNVLLHATAPTRAEWGWALGWAVAMLVLGFIWFWQAEELYGRD